MSDTYNCSLGPPWVNVTLSKMYKNEKKLLYPVNVGRNIARESAPTFYVFASDIELYPNPNLPAKFLEMIRRRDQPALYKPNPKVFVLSIFEVDEKNQPPNNKTHLVSPRFVRTDLCEIVEEEIVLPGKEKKRFSVLHRYPRFRFNDDTYFPTCRLSSGK